MTAEMTIIEFGAIETSTTTSTQLNLGSTVSANLNATSNPITVGTYGISKCFKLSFSGTFTAISGIKCYVSDGSYITGETINIGTSTSYSAPTGGSYADSNASTALPTSAPSTANILIGGTISGTITDTENTTDFIFLQSSMSIIASSTQIPEKTLTVTFDET